MPYTPPKTADALKAEAAAQAAGSQGFDGAKPLVLSFTQSQDLTDLGSPVASRFIYYTTASNGGDRTRPIVDQLNRGVDQLRTQVEQLQKDLASNTQTEQIRSLEKQIHEITTTTTRIQASSTELTAPVIIPASADMQIHLVSAHSLDRLEEYRADENKYMLLIGIFGGAIAGVLVNWFTNEQFTVTRSSLVLLGLLVLLMVGCGYRTYQISQRAAQIRSRMLHNEPPIATPPPTAP